MRQRFLLVAAASLLFAAPLLPGALLAQGGGQGAAGAAAQGGRQGGQGAQGGAEGRQGGQGAPAGGAQGRQGGGGRGRGGPPPGPAPRNAEGRVLLSGATPKERGLWLPGVGITVPLAPPETVPFHDWSRAVYMDRQEHELEPHARCKASGVSRPFLTPYGVEIVELPELQRIYIFDVGGPHTYRTIFMDGRTHPKNLAPTYYGYSVGWWEGDTLVIETTGFNEDFWLDRRGFPHTEKLRTLERLTRTDSNTIRYEVTIDDPGAYSKPWTGGFNLRWDGGTELFEYVCQQANYAGELMVGTMDKVDRTVSHIP
jgi:hypothetical protein